MNNDSMPPETDGCLDNPSPMDYRARDLMGSVGTADKPVFPKDRLHIFNQGADEETLMSCTRQGLANITNGNNLISQGSQDILLGKKEWVKAILKNPEIKKGGDYLQNALKQFLDDKLIAGYYIVSGKQEHMDAIDKGHWIYSGSNNGNWRKVRDEKVYGTLSSSSGHAFLKGFGYNESGMDSANSYGDLNGFFHFPWELVETTYTSYAIIDFVDEEAILLYKKTLMDNEIKEAVDLGIFSGNNPDAPASRSEVARMVLRAYKLSK